MEELFKRTGAVRRFQDKEIPDDIIEKIINAGVWGPSIFGVQSWKIVVIKKDDYISKIAGFLNNNTKQMPPKFDILLKISQKTILSSKLLIAVYNNGDLCSKIEDSGKDFAEKAEIQSIGAVMQNMLLQIYDLGLSGLWMDTPVLFSHEINTLLNIDGKLSAMLAVGWPANEVLRSKRKTRDELVRYF